VTAGCSHVVMFAETFHHFRPVGTVQVDASGLRNVKPRENNDNHQTTIVVSFVRVLRNRRIINGSRRGSRARVIIIAPDGGR